jgi:hypothetical protein
MTDDHSAHPDRRHPALTAVLPALAMALVHGVVLHREYPDLGRGAVTLGLVAGLLYWVLALKMDRLVEYWETRRGSTDISARQAGFGLVLRLYPLLLLVPEFYDTTRSVHNQQTRNFLVLQGVPELLLCHLTMLVSLGALLVARLRVDRLRAAVALLVAVNFVAYFFRNQGEYNVIHVVRQLQQWHDVPGPWRHRVLVPWLFEGLSAVGLVSTESLFSALFVISVPVVFFTILLLDDLLQRFGEGGFWLAALTPLLLIFGFDVVYVTTLPELLFAALFLRYAVDRRLVPCLVVLALGVLNRESFVVFSVSYLVLAWQGQGQRRFDRRLLYEVAAIAAVAGGLRLMTWLALGHHKVVEIHRMENLRNLWRYIEVVLGLRDHPKSLLHHKNFVYAVNKPLMVFASLHLAALFLGRRAARFWLATVVVSALYLVLILLFGKLNESRMLFVTLPLVLLTLHTSLRGTGGELELEGEGEGEG